LRQGLAMQFKLVSNSQSSCFVPSPKCWDYRFVLLHPARFLFIF
jgi:hypothetical protein